MAFRILSVAACLLAASADNDGASPVQRVIGLLEEMEVKVTEEGKAEDAKFEEYTALCERRSDDLGYEIKTQKSEVEELNAVISKATSKIEAVASTLEEVQASIGKAEADLKAATDVRKQEEEDFKAGEKDLIETMDTLERATGILEKEESKGGAALVQIKNAPNVLQAVQVMLDASILATEDATRLTSFLQNKFEDYAMQPPTPPAYEKKSGGIIELLEDMMDKSKEELNELRKKETDAKNSFGMVAQSLQDEIKYSKEDVDQNMKVKGEQEKVKADAAKDLSETATSLAEDEKTLSDFTADCKAETRDYNEESKTRAQELEALGAAKASLSESVPSSFLQLSSNIHSSQDLKHFEVVRIVRDLGKQQSDQQLVLLARRMDSMMRSSNGVDVFAKIKEMISGMIANMEKNLQEAASKKQYCDAEMKKAASKKDAKTAEISDVQTKIDQTAAKSAELKEQVSELQTALTVLAETSANMTKLRKEEKELYDKVEPEQVALLDGVKTALKVLSDFYKKQGGGTSATRTGAAGGIVGRLEDIESEGAMELTEMRQVEKSEAAKFETDMKDMKLEKVTKEKDVEYKTAEAKRLDAEVGELESDKDSLSTEMGAIMEFKKGLDAECLVTPASFAEKQAKKQQEIDGLKTALSALGAAEPILPAIAFIQLKQARLRGLKLQTLAP